MKQNSDFSDRLLFFSIDRVYEIDPVKSTIREYKIVRMILLLSSFLFDLDIYGSTVHGGEFNVVGVLK